MAERVMDPELLRSLKRISIEIKHCFTEITERGVVEKMSEFSCGPVFETIRLWENEEPEKLALYVCENPAPA